MFDKFACVLLAVVATSSLLISAELIELSDANVNRMPLDVSKPLRTVQAAVAKHYAFESAQQAMKFLEDCQSLQASLKSVDDGAYEGLAGKIRAMVAADSKLVEMCKVTPDEIEQFMLFDQALADGNVSAKRLAAVIELGDKLDSNPKLATLLGNLALKVQATMSETVLSHAGADTDLLFGDLKTSWISLDHKYKSACEIEALKPICRLVRRTKQSDVSAIGADIADFTSAVKSYDQEKIDAHVEASGVSAKQLKSTCSSIKGSMHAFYLLDEYRTTGLVSDADIEQQTKSDAKFDFYFNLHELCKTQLD